MWHFFPFFWNDCVWGKFQQNFLTARCCSGDVLKTHECYQIRLWGCYFIFSAATVPTHPHQHRPLLCCFPSEFLFKGRSYRDCSQYYDVFFLWLSVLKTLVPVSVGGTCLNHVWLLCFCQIYIEHVICIWSVQDGVKQSRRSVPQSLRYLAVVCKMIWALI